MNDQGSSRRPRLKHLGVGLGILLLLASGIALATWIQGNVSGEEFAPTHFQTRTFRFYEIPLLGLQVTPISRTATTHPTSRYLNSQSLIAVPANPPTDWDVARLRRGARQTTEGDARLLVAQLELRAAGGSYWEQWSRDHPAAAAVLWPVVQRLAQRELYVLLPELFQLARLHPEPFALRAELDRYLRHSYLELADDFFEAGQHEQSRSVLQDALSDFPGDPRFQERLDALPAVDDESA